MFRHECPSSHALVFVTNYNPRLRAYYKLLERAMCLVAEQIRHPSDAEMLNLPAATGPILMGINLHRDTATDAVNWRGYRTRPNRAFPLMTPSCPTRPGRACIQQFSQGGTVWDVLVCSDLAAAEASNRKIPYRDELIRYAIHSLLHLAGESDSDPESAEHMFRRQEMLVEETIGKEPHPAGRMDERGKR
jgi:rRNA maturation RNase YbeY